MSAHTHRTLTPALLAICAVVGALAVTGCGASASTGGSHSSSTGASAAASTSAGQTDLVTSGTRPHHAAGTPARSNPDIGGATTHRTPKTGGSHTDASAGAGLATARSSDRIVKAGASQKARSVSTGNDDTNAGPAHQLNPCSLVTLSQAQAFMGGQIANRFEAPQGPTCIYKASGVKTEITLAVQSVVASQLTGHLAQRQKLTVAGRAAYCGKLGTELLVVPLSSHQLLSVSAPCSVARQFAAAAVSRLTA